MKLNLTLLLIVFIVYSTSAQTEGNLEIKTTTVSFPGGYSDHCFAVWVEDTTGKFIRTIKIQAKSPKYENKLFKWFSTPNRNRVDAISGASLTKHQSHTLIWNCKDDYKNTVPDGIYNIWIEGSQSNTESYPHKIQITKGSIEQTFTIPNNSNIINTSAKFVTLKPPVALFAADLTSIKEYEKINFSDQSTGYPTSWSWSFPGGNPATSTAQNPIVTYNKAGKYSVTLSVTNGKGTDPEEKTEYITVATAPLEVLPWTESFTMANNLTNDAAPTSWSATRFKVLNNEIASAGVNAECLFTTGPINITSKRVKVSLNVRGAGGLDKGSDYLKLYKIIDGVQEVKLAAADGLLPATVWSAEISSGSILQLVIKALVSVDTEVYYFDNLKIEDLDTLPNIVNIDDISENPANIYPNPVTSTLHIEHSEGSYIRIFNMQGQLIYNKLGVGNMTSIEISELEASGLVFIHVNSEVNSTIFKATVIK